MSLFVESSSQEPAKTGGSSIKVRAAKPTTDPVFEAELLQLLSSLEFQRAHLEQCFQQKRPSQVLPIAQNLVGQIVNFAERHIPANLENQDWCYALAKVGEFFSSAKRLSDQLSGSGIRSLFGLMNGANTGEDRKQIFNQCLASMVDVVQHYFSLFTNRFPNSLAARGWVEAGAIYLVSLKQVVKQNQY